MKNYFFLLAVCFLVACESNTDIKGTQFNYPKTRKDTTEIDNYFGKKVQDPYRWLEDDHSKETEEWVLAQQSFTDSVLGTFPYRDKIHARLASLWKYERASAPFKKGHYIFQYKNNGEQNQNVLYIMDSLGGEARVLIDPNLLSAEGTTSMGNFSVSYDGKFGAYTLSEAGSDWETIHVIELDSGKELKDVIRWVKFSGISWRGNGFYYSAYDQPLKGKEYSVKNEFHKVYYHKLNTDQTADELVYEDNKHPLRNHYLSITEDERFLLLHISESTSGEALYFKDNTIANSAFTAIDTSFEFDYNVIDNIDDKLLIKTNNAAPLNRLISVDTKAPEKEFWKTVVPESSDKLNSVSVCNEKLVLNYLKDVRTGLYIYSLEGELENEIQLPDLGMAYFSGKKDENIAFYTFVNYVNPGTIYRYDMINRNSILFSKSDVQFDPDNYITEQVKFQSKDGTTIPMFLTHKKGLKKDGNNPVFLYGYGGFNISITPRFSIANMVFLENGGIYAVANIRGGGEYGESWHKAGTLLNKQNVYDDFIAAAEYLISSGYTNSSKLAVHGRSNGGLLIGAVLTQRPDLYRACIPSVGVLDMLRYHKFTIGWAWASDYGTSDNEKDFNNLIKYSPLHNVKDTIYPAIMITTADHDDRVVPAHSFKFVASLQEHQKGQDPVLIRIDINAGHGGGKPVSKQIDEWTDIWTFIFHYLDIHPEQ